MEIKYMIEQDLFVTISSKRLSYLFEFGEDPNYVIIPYGYKIFLKEFDQFCEYLLVCKLSNQEIAKTLKI